MMKIKKSIIIVLVLTIMASLFVMPTYADDFKSGKCGDNVYYNFPDRTLTISGTGAMYDLKDYESLPCKSAVSFINVIIVEEGVTHIGDRAFSGYSSLKAVFLPKSLKSIGKYAFYNCKNLERVDYAKDVVCDSNAFYGCTKLLETKTESTSGKCGKDAYFSFADGVLTISGTGETYNYIDDYYGMDYYGNSTVKKWNGLYSEIEKVVVEEGITRIGNYSFYGFYWIKELVLPESLEVIGDSAFMYCTSLEKANVADDVTCETCAFSCCDKFHPLQIIKQPPQTIEVKKAGDYAVVSIEVEGDGVTYEWRYSKINNSYVGTKSTTASGQTANYKTKVTKERYGRKVQCIITDRYGRYIRSDIACLKFRDPYPTIISQPHSIAVESGKTAKVSVEATGDGLKYVWYYKNTNQALFHKSTNIKTSYSLSMNEARDGRQMYCVITDAYGRSVTTETVTFSVAKGTSCPVIVTQPQPTSAKIGDDAVISVEAAGEDLTYVWYYKNTNQKYYHKSSVTEPVFTMDMTEARDGRQMYCEVINKDNRITKTDVVTFTAIK